MTAAELLSALRSLLDESTEEFWTDVECFSALTGGQEDYVSILLAQYKARTLINPLEPLPEILRSLYTETQIEISSSIVPLPETFLYDISIYIGDPYNRPLLKRELSKGRLFDINNTYSGVEGYYYSLTESSIILEIPAPSENIDLTFGYLKKPTIISVTETETVEPTLPEYTHDGIVTYAFAQLLKKSKRMQEAAQQFQEFISTIKYI